jgi:hypothetical protein
MSDNYWFNLFRAIEKKIPSEFHGFPGNPNTVITRLHLMIDALSKARLERDRAIAECEQLRYELKSFKDFSSRRERAIENIR